MSKSIFRFVHDYWGFLCFFFLLYKRFHFKLKVVYLCILFLIYMYFQLKIYTYMYIYEGQIISVVLMCCSRLLLVACNFQLLVEAIETTVEEDFSFSRERDVMCHWAEGKHKERSGSTDWTDSGQDLQNRSSGISVMQVYQFGAGLGRVPPSPCSRDGPAIMWQDEKHMSGTDKIKSWQNCSERHHSRAY